MRRTSHPSFVFQLIHLFVSDQKRKRKKKNTALFSAVVPLRAVVFLDTIYSQNFY